MLFSKKAIRVVGLLLLLGVLVLAASLVIRVLPPKQQVKDISQPVDGQGIYESCPPDRGEDCLEHLERMASVGFKLVINYDQLYANATEELAYATKAQAVGMKIIWALNDRSLIERDGRLTFTKLAASCNCSDNAGFIRYVVNLVKDLPATWGYYIGDEVESSLHDSVKILSDIVKLADPHHPRLFIGAAAFPSRVAPTLAPYADTAEVLGTDYYPVGRRDIPDAVNATAAITKAIQAVADQTSRDSAIVLQATSLGHYQSFEYLCSPFPSCVPYPTTEQMRLIRNLALQNAHLRLLLWFSYFDILKSDNPIQRWENLVAAAAPLGSSLKGKFASPLFILSSPDYSAMVPLSRSDLRRNPGIR